MESYKSKPSNVSSSSCWEIIKELNNPVIGCQGVVKTHICLKCRVTKSFEASTFAVTQTKSGKFRAGGGALRHLKRWHDNNKSQTCGTNAEHAQIKLNIKRKANSLTSLVSESRDEQVLKVHEAIMDMVMEHRMPLSFLTSRSLDKLLRVCNIRNYTKLAKSRGKTLLQLKFGQMLEIIKIKLANVQKYYRNRFHDESWKWLTVLHDGLDNRIPGGLYGVSLSFIDPEDFEYHLVTVAVRPILDHKATTVKNAVLTLLRKVFNVERSEIAFGMSDTTPSAVKSSSLLARTAAECDMHNCNFAMEYSLGIRKRTVNRAVLEEFPEFLEVRKEYHKAIKFLMAEQAPKRFQDYSNLIQRQKKWKVLKMSLPNDTRISGEYLLIKTILRSWHALDFFYMNKMRSNKTRDDRIIKGSTAKIIAEFEATMRPLAQQRFVVQTERVDGLKLIEIRELIKSVTVETFDVVDTNDEEWSPTTPFHQLPRKRLHKYSRSGQDEKTLSPLGSRFHDRLCDTVRNYFAVEPTNDQLLSLALDPIGMSTRFFLECDSREINNISGTELMKKAKYALKSELDKLYSIVKIALLSDTSVESRQQGEKSSYNFVNNGFATNYVNNVDLSDDEASSCSIIEVNMLQMQHLKKALSCMNEAVNGPDLICENNLSQIKEEIANEYTKWINLRVDWVQEFKLQAIEKGLNTSCPEIARTLKHLSPEFLGINPLFIKKHVDVLQWARRNKQLFPWILGYLFPKYLALPGSNAFQERCFSGAGLHNSPLRLRLGDHTFEKIVLMSQNYAWLERQQIPGLSEIAKDSARLLSISNTLDSFAASYYGDSCNEGKQDCNSQGKMSGLIVEEYIESVCCLADSYLKTSTSGKKRKLGIEATI